MVTYDEYFQDILTQVLDSYDVLAGLDDRPGDLDIIKKEILRIMALFRVVAGKVRESGKPTPSHMELAAIAESYVDTYSFDHEIDMIRSLYADDVNRIRNIRLKILESLDRKKVTSRVKYIIEDMK